MSIATLRFAPWRAKSQLPPSKYESLTSSVSRFLFHVLSLSDTQLDVAWARSFVSAYVQDAARHVLHALDSHEEAQASDSDISICNLTLQLAGRLAKVPAGLDVSSLVDLAIVYGRKNATSVQILFNDSLNSSPALLEEFKIEVIPAFAATLGKPDRRSVYMLSQLLHCSPQVALLFVEDRKFSLELAKSYQVRLDKLAISRGGMISDAQDKVESWQKDWLYIKTGLLDMFHALVQALLQNVPSRHADFFFDILFALLDLPSSSAVPKKPFVSQTLLADYQYAFDLSGALAERFKDADDARVDLLAATLKDFSPAPRGAKPAGVLSVLLKNKTRPSVVASNPMVVSKGKGKAKEAEGPEHDEALDLAVSQVLDIFPNETPQHIKRCLRTFNGDSELLISALLEGTLPPDLADDNSTREIPLEEAFEFTKDRRNVWDDDAMDFSRLRIGKRRDDADELLQDRSFIEQMKADIIRRAEELSDDEEAAREPRELATPFYEDLDEDVESLVDKGVKVAGDGEDSDESDDQGNADTPATISPETILELAYIENPKIFDRDAATRRSKPRADLKSRTDWGDEQIEGWRIMLERNPNKEKILRKHEFAGNSPLVPDTNAPEPGPSGLSRGGHSHRGRGGDGRGRGRGGRQGGGGGDTMRGRAWKDKNKARQANHNRKRGHDKKMARGGAGGSAPV